MEDEDLWRDAAARKHGAADVVSRLQNLMNIGAPSIADIAYTIRLREKEDFRIVEKVKRKRLKDPSYTVGRIRDVVGLRIVTLYRLDALDIIPRLIQFLKEQSGPAPGLFVSPELEEIKIYSTNPRGDAQALPQRITSLFDSLGYGDKAEIEDTPSNYTSIHLVTWCRGRYDSGHVPVPLEIQIRTALEDAWGEIDHKLKYKPAVQRLTVRDESVLQSCLTHLNIMKNFIDGAAQYADQIRVQADVTARRFISTTHRLVEDTSAIVRKMDLAPHVRTQIESALEHQMEAMHPSRRGRQHAEARTGNLRNAIRELTASLDLVAEQVPAESADRARLLKYYLPLEIALCNFQLGMELQRDEKFLGESVRIYQQVLAEFPERAIIRYRYGRALSAMGDLPAAIKKLEEAHELLVSGKDNTIDKNHWLRLSVPRNLGVFYWERAEAERTDAPLNSATLEVIRQNNLKAYEITKVAYNIRVDPDNLCDQFDLSTNYRGRIANNLLYYLRDFEEAGGDKTSLTGYQADEEQTYIDLLERYVELIESPETIHTMLRHFQRTGETARVKELGNRLLRMLRDKGVVDGGGKSHEEDMLRAAVEAAAGEK